jgi:hypothetical protein
VDGTERRTDDAQEANNEMMGIYTPFIEAAKGKNKSKRHYCPLP